MINIKLWNKSINTNKDDKLLILLKDSFNVTSTSKLNLVNNKTLIITLFINKMLVGTVSLMSNDDLLKYFENKNQSIESLMGIYTFRAEKGIFIYNLAVGKKFRNKGIAKKLLEIAMYVGRLKKFKYCQVHCENIISETIFKNRGFNLENSFSNSKKQNVKLMSAWL
jgi:hypothetical protein